MFFNNLGKARAFSESRQERKTDASYRRQEEVATLALLNHKIYLKPSKGGKAMSKYTEADVLKMTAQEFRSIVRRGEWQDSIHGLGRGYAVTDIVVLPKEYAFDFAALCHINMTFFITGLLATHSRSAAFS